MRAIYSTRLLTCFWSNPLLHSLAIQESLDIVPDRNSFQQDVTVFGPPNSLNVGVVTIECSIDFLRPPYVESPNGGRIVPIQRMSQWAFRAIFPTIYGQLSRVAHQAEGKLPRLRSAQCCGLISRCSCWIIRNWYFCGIRSTSRIEGTRDGIWRPADWSIGSDQYSLFLQLAKLIAYLCWMEEQ